MNKQADNSIPISQTVPERTLPFGRPVSPAILETRIFELEKDLENEKIAHDMTTLELAGWIGRVRQLERLNGVLARRVDELEGQSGVL
jgi:hypothetical protein